MAFFKTSDGVSISYEDHGGEGQAVVLLSGFSGIQEEWQDYIPFLQEKGFRPVTMDWRAHGQSERTPKNLRIGRLAADLHELFLLLHLTNIVLVGHSMGGAASWAYLSLFGESRIDKVVIIDESPKLVNDETWSAGIVGMNWNTYPVMIATFLQQRLTVSPINQSLKDNLQVQKVKNPFNFDLALPLLKNHVLEDWRGNVYDMTRPFLFVAGEESPLWKSEYYNDFKGMMGEDDQVVVIPKTGHLPHLEKPEQFKEILAKFIM
ncbi:alpha/beta hydrolase [Fructobacillus sp. CRL 2054]|uniref:alpha/beta fold hydrolase n=1 Tax=Fructobacillus sp. CRL 2054 TaxID=2763007 RepID=UPI002377FC16|nr:alpha/beta hydrolase [Fructobacillus sp. CRL 2054]MDD9139006.1 alpha/beta hydrolase [Fructobacillus sp. CRL 2054]